MSTTVAITEAEVYRFLSEIPDPEIPVISITELGIVREVKIVSDEEILVKITPTYSGCPAMDLINIQIRRGLVSKGFKRIRVEYQLSPAWTTDWLPEEAKQKLRDFGITPPQGKSTDMQGLFSSQVIPCPHCGSENTEMTSRFGSTSCKALYKCLSCHEPFEYFKCH